MESMDPGGDKLRDGVVDDYGFSFLCRQETADTDSRYSKTLGGGGLGALAKY